MHVLFVVPRFAAPGQFYSYPIGLAYVYAFLKRHGVSVSCLNLCHESCASTHASLEQEFAKVHVDMVCTGGISTYWEQINDILMSAKRISRDVITVVGGAIVTADPETALAHLPIDYGVTGEGEYTLVELLETLQTEGGRPENVKGLAFRSPNGQLVLTGGRGEIKNLDALPIPEYQDFGFRDWTENAKNRPGSEVCDPLGEVRFAAVIGSRSCPFSCTFCYHPLGKKYRQRSLDHIFGEIDYLTTTYDINMIHFVDELFCADQRRMLAFAERIRPYGIGWGCNLRVSQVSLELLETLVSSGLMCVGMGIESMNDDVLKSMKKHTTKAMNITALETIRQARLYSSSNIILGDPADTTETVNETITWWKSNPVYGITLGLIRAVPDGPIYRDALQEGIIKDRHAHIKNLPLVNLSKMSDKQYYSLVLKVHWWNLMHTYVASGTLIGTRRLEECHGDKHFYEIQLRCPVCGSEQTNRKFLDIPTPNVRIICTHCSTSFKVPQKQAFPGDYSLVATARYALPRLVVYVMTRFSFFRKYRYMVKQMLDRFVRL